jgi:hypothetical protein
MADMICHKVYEFLMSILNIYILGLEVGGVTTKRQGFKWNTVCTRDFTCILVILSVFKFSWFQLGFSHSFRQPYVLHCLEFIPLPGAAGFQISNPPVFQTVSLLSSLKV